MSADPIKSPTPQSEALDEETEKAMAELIQAGLTHGYTTKLAIADCRICQEGLALARSRIRTLIEEARKEGYQSDKPFFMKPLQKLNDD